MSGSAVAGRLPITAWPARVVTRAARDAAARTLVAAAGAPPWHRTPVARVHPTDCRLGLWLACRERLARCVLRLILQPGCPRIPCVVHGTGATVCGCTVYHAVVTTVLQVQSSLCRECATPTSFLLVIGALHGRPSRRHRLPPPVAVCRAMRYNSSCLVMCWPSPCQACCRTRLGRRASSLRL